MSPSALSQLRPPHLAIYHETFDLALYVLGEGMADADMADCKAEAAKLKGSRSHRLNCWLFRLLRSLAGGLLRLLWIVSLATRRLLSLESRWRAGLFAGVLLAGLRFSPAGRQFCAPEGNLACWIFCSLGRNFARRKRWRSQASIAGSSSNAPGGIRRLW
jgi:hypothetical protein